MTAVMANKAVLQWSAVTVTHLGIGKSVTITDCHSHSVTLSVIQHLPSVLYKKSHDLIVLRAYFSNILTSASRIGLHLMNNHQKKKNPWTMLIVCLDCALLICI